MRPLAETAELIARKRDWGRLYDLPQLARNEVPVAASAYRPDIYVDWDGALETAAHVGSLRTWTSDRLHHDALGNDTDEVLGGLGNLLVEQSAVERSPVSEADRA